MHNHIDFVFGKCAEIDHGPRRNRCSEHDILQFRGYHGTTPAICQGAARGLLDQVPVFLICPHVRSMHNFDDFPLHAPGKDTIFLPDLLPLFRGPADTVETSLLPAEFGQCLFTELNSNILHRPAFSLYLKDLCQHEKFVFVLDAIVGLPVGRSEKYERRFQAVVHVR